MADPARINFASRVPTVACAASISEASVGAEERRPTFEICPCCGGESGYETAIHAERRVPCEVARPRRTVVQPNARPANWSLDDQLLQVPERFATEARRRAGSIPYAVPHRASPSRCGRLRLKLVPGNMRRMNLRTPRLSSRSASLPHRPAQQRRVQFTDHDDAGDAASMTPAR